MPKCPDKLQSYIVSCGLYVSLSRCTKCVHTHAVMDSNSLSQAARVFKCPSTMWIVCKFRYFCLCWCATYTHINSSVATVWGRQSYTWYIACLYVYSCRLHSEMILTCGNSFSAHRASTTHTTNHIKRKQPSKHSVHFLCNEPY